MTYVLTLKMTRQDGATVSYHCHTLEANTLEEVEAAVADLGRRVKQNLKQEHWPRPD